LKKSRLRTKIAVQKDVCEIRIEVLNFMVDNCWELEVLVNERKRE